MIELILQDQHFKDVTTPNEFWPPKETIYENCVFSGSNFIKSKLSGLKFYDCRFEHCDLSLATVQQIIFQQVEFNDCKIAGVLFDHCNPFALEMRFSHCKLDHSSFYQLKLQQAVFQNCSLRGIDFCEAVMKGARFSGSDLMDAKFDHTDVEKADFRMAINYQINPASNKIKGANFSLDGLPGLLAAYQIKVTL